MCIIGDSIVLQTLIDTLATHPELFSTIDRKTIIHDLITRLNINDTARILQPIGQITKLNNSVVSEFQSDKILSGYFKDNNLENTDEIFYINNDNIDTPEILPANVVLNMNLKQPLTIPSNYLNKFYTKTELPSGFFNILYLKNNKNPHYLFDYKISGDYFNYDIICVSGITEATNQLRFKLRSSLIQQKSELDFIINEKSKFEKFDRNAKINKLYDFDISNTITANSLENIGILNNYNTNTLFNYAVEKDQSLVVNSEYLYRFPTRMATKHDDYFEQKNNRHIINNKLYNLGELLGLRNYIKIGNLFSEDKLWFSYKYNTIYNKTLLDSYNTQSSISTGEKTFNRIADHWLYNKYNQIINDKTMKLAGEDCPWRGSITKTNWLPMS